MLYVAVVAGVACASVCGPLKDHVAGRFELTTMVPVDGAAVETATLASADSPRAFAQRIENVVF